VSGARFDGAWTVEWVRHKSQKLHHTQRQRRHPMAAMKPDPDQKVMWDMAQSVVKDGKQGPGKQEDVPGAVDLK
jgi:hypothetical protein